MREFLSCGWIWMWIGVVLMVAEIAIPGFVIFFFGLSAITVGACRFVFGETFSLSWQLAGFSAFALAYLLLLRRWVTGVFSGFSVTSRTDFDNESIGRVGRLTEPISPPKTGRVLIGDAEWNAAADVPIAAGADVRVISQTNLTMTVEEIK